MFDLFLKNPSTVRAFHLSCTPFPQQLLQGHLGMPDNKAKVVNARHNVPFVFAIPKFLFTASKQQKSTLFFI